MDRYLFKAKRLDNGEWVEGYLYRLSENNHPFIMLKDRFGEAYEVSEETVCQFTGLHDKNGNKIWEHDIVKFDNCSAYSIFYDSDYCCLGSCWYSDFDAMYKYRNTELEVLGNKFDNPELMGVE